MAGEGERVRKRPDQAAATSPAQQVRREFGRALQMMSGNVDAMAANFAWCAAQLAGQPDQPARVRGMMEFAVAYHRFGLETAQGVIQENGGVPVSIVIPDITEVEDGTRKYSYDKSSRTRDGFLVGIVGARRAGLTREPVFDGIAVIRRKIGPDQIVPVGVKPDGTTVLNPGFMERFRPDRSALRLIEELYPPTERDRRHNRHPEILGHGPEGGGERRG